VTHNGSSRELTADNIVIATGARPRMIKVPGLPQERTLTNESLFDLTNLPKHLVIVGAGIIALEMAFAFRKLGSKVTIFSLDNRPLPNHIHEVSETMVSEIERQGITAHFNALAKSFDESTRRLTLTDYEFGDDDGEIYIHEVDKVLVAVGRVKNLGVARAGPGWNQVGPEDGGAGQFDWGDERQGCVCDWGCHADIRFHTFGKRAGTPGRPANRISISATGEEGAALPECDLQRP
jgi:pyruvate/2-oxoglutarate dehydrogenase complex dihydrolipoamide dehydrogenase (E3) component